MQCTPESSLYPERSKGKPCYEDCTDSGYSGLFHSPQSFGVDSCSSLSPIECNETPKENLRLPITPKAGMKELSGGSRGAQQGSAISWCETPRLHKRDASLRYRLLMSKPNTDVKTNHPRSPLARRSDSSINALPENWLSTSFDFPGNTKASSTLELEQSLPLSSRKRRILFSQVRASTLEDGKLHSGHLPNFEGRVSLSEADYSESISASGPNNIETPRLSKCLPASPKEDSQSPVSGATNSLNDSSSFLCTPSCINTPRYLRSVSEDSGFSYLTFDKSQDSSVDHDGSFQELLLSDTRGNGGTPNLAEAKRRSRLQRQTRLSTLKEGGSQSEEDTVERLHEGHRRLSHCKDVFDDCATPRCVSSVKCVNTSTSGVASLKQDYVTPIRDVTAKPASVTSFNAVPSNPDVTPLRTTPVNLNLTPALQLVHAMCQQKAQMFVGQSPSLKEQLKSTASLADTPSMFRTTMPLSGLIGRKMGLGKVDILTELRKRNLRHILAVIFGHLTSESIHRCGQVCKSWDELIQQDKQANFRRRNHLSEVEATPEVGEVSTVDWPMTDRSHVSRLVSKQRSVSELSRAVRVPDAETRLALPKRSALKTVQAQSLTSSYCTPQSGNSTLTQSEHSASNSSKREKFLEVAKTLFNDECLRPCPRCQHPARCHSVKGEGVCSRDNCGFKFCTGCLCAFHGSRECGSQSVGRRKKDILLPGSAQSKRNVRRL